MIRVKNETPTALGHATGIAVTDADRARIKSGLGALERYAAQYAEGKGLAIVTQSDLIARLLHLCEEVAELAQAFREGNPDADQLPGFKHAEEESADILALLLMITSATGCRLSDAFIAKLERCSTSRPFLHGKRW